MALAENLTAAERAITFVKSKVKTRANVVADRIASYGGMEKFLEYLKSEEKQGRPLQTPQWLAKPTCASCGGEMTAQDTPTGPFYVCANHPNAKVAAPLSAVAPTHQRAASPASQAVRAVQQQAWSEQPRTLAEMHVVAEVITAAGAGNCGEQAMVAFDYLGRNFIVRPVEYMQFSNTAGGYDHAWVVIGRFLGRGADPAKLPTWGADAVWCDPWQGDEGRYYSITDFIQGKVRNLNWMYKLDTVEKVEAGRPNWRFRYE